MSFRFFFPQLCVLGLKYSLVTGSDCDGQPPKKIKKPNSPLNTPLLNLSVTSPSILFPYSRSPEPPRTPTPPPGRAPIIVTSKNVAAAIAMAMEQTGSKPSTGKDNLTPDNLSLGNLNLSSLVTNTSQGTGCSSSKGGNNSGSNSGFSEIKSVIVRAGPSSQNTVSNSTCLLKNLNEIFKHTFNYESFRFNYSCPLKLPMCLLYQRLRELTGIRLRIREKLAIFLRTSLWKQLRLLHYKGNANYRLNNQKCVYYIFRRRNMKLRRALCILVFVRYLNL